MGEFLQTYRGAFYGVLRWPQLEEVWQNLRQSPEGWFVYETDQPPPNAPVSAEKFLEFINSTDQFLREEHEEEYCGIVYINDKQNPDFIKIYDPNNLGVVCGYSEAPPPPRWVLSRQTPEDLTQIQSQKNKASWWKRLFAKN